MPRGPPATVKVSPLRTRIARILLFQLSDTNSVAPSGDSAIPAG
jgi:hypothetical protein